MSLTASATLPEAQARAIADALAADAALEALAVDAAEIAPGCWRVRVYLTDAGHETERAALARCAEACIGKDAPRFDVEALPDIDWVAKSLEGLTPVVAGRFVVHGRHDRGRIPAGRIAIEIEAGQAFGTGHHATTAGSLMVLDRLMRARKFQRPLDLGTGSGVLAIAIAKALRGPVVASDIDPVSVRLARANARLNDVGNRVTCVTARGVAHAAIKGGAPFDLVVANILAEPLCRLAPSLAPLIARGGTLVLSGLLARQRERVVVAYAMQGMRLARAHLVDGWATLVLRARARPPASG